MSPLHKPPWNTNIAFSSPITPCLGWVIFVHHIFRGSHAAMWLHSAIWLQPFCLSCWEVNGLNPPMLPDSFLPYACGRENEPGNIWSCRLPTLIFMSNSWWYALKQFTIQCCTVTTYLYVRLYVKQYLLRVWLKAVPYACLCIVTLWINARYSVKLKVAPLRKGVYLVRISRFNKPAHSGNNME